jgi:hypothetical protein
MHSESQQPDAGLTELGRKLAAHDLADVTVVATRTLPGAEVVWMRNAADMLRLLTALVENLAFEAEQNELGTGLAALADHEVDGLAAALQQLHQEMIAESARRTSGQ